MKRFWICLGVLALLALAVVPASADGRGPPGGMFYTNDQVWQTVLTPTNLPAHGKFDTLYTFPGTILFAVSDSAPGDQDYNGGRWEVREVTFVGIAPMQFTNAEDLLAAEAAGDVVIGPVVARFVCPLIPF